MMDLAKQFENLDELRGFIEATICAQNELEVGAFPVSQRVLVRGGSPCGMYFCLHGPREVKFSAIWETERNTLLFYGSAGDRLETMQLAPGLAVPSVA